MNPPKLLLAILFLILIGCEQDARGNSKHPEADIPGWPPNVGDTYPDFEVVDHRGKIHRLSDFKGKPLLIELTAIPCAGCQAFSGGNVHGGYGKVRPQKNLGSFEEYLARFGGGMKASDPRFTFMQLMLYDLKMGTPSKEEIAAWAKHFKLDNLNNTYVVAPTGHRPKNSYKLIPGFHLLDKNFKVVSDSSGHYPKNNLYRHLIPLLAKLVGQRK